MAARAPDASITVSKVAAITLAFWIMKICATTVGETAGDLLAQTWKIGYGVSTVLLLGFFVVTLIGQLRAKAFHPFLYWGVILSTSTAGTTLSDYMDRTLELGYATGSAIIASVLVAVLATWKFSTGSLSVNTITDRKTETFYWFAILASNTLGTALGDYLADSSGLGYGLSNLLISSGIALTVLGYYVTRVSRTTLFWIAFVLTRPFGATMGDLLTKSHEKGGMAFGTLGASLVLLAVLVALILWDRRQRAIAEAGWVGPY
jgi:uncharacterized membrane-anchored protein